MLLIVYLSQLQIVLCSPSRTAHSVFTAPAGEPFELADAELEVRLLGSPTATTTAAAAGHQAVVVDGQALEAAVQQHYGGRVLAVNEVGGRE